jgi:hypothetical protein
MLATVSNPSLLSCVHFLFASAVGQNAKMQATAINSLAEKSYQVRLNPILAGVAVVVFDPVLEVASLAHVAYSAGVVAYRVNHHAFRRLNAFAVAVINHAA